MRLKSLLVIAVFVVACSFAASAQTFGFASAGGFLYCNYEQLSYAGTGEWGGVDNISACGAATNATISGFSAALSADGEKTGGPGVIYGDSIYATNSGDLNAQWTVFTKLKANKVNRFGAYTGGYGWIGVAGFSGFFAGSNIGYLSATVPGKNGITSSKGPSTLAKTK